MVWSAGVHKNKKYVFWKIYWMVLSVRVHRYFCEDDGDYRVYCNVCDKFSIDRSYKNRFKSGTRINGIHQRQRSNNANKWKTYLIINCFEWSKCMCSRLPMIMTISPNAQIMMILV